MIRFRGAVIGEFLEIVLGPAHDDVAGFDGSGEHEPFRYGVDQVQSRQRRNHVNGKLNTLPVTVPLGGVGS